MAAVDDIVAQLIAASQQPQTQVPALGTLAQAPQAAPVYTIRQGPEYNKWDEALMQLGRIRIPKELDEPQIWLNQDHIKAFLNGTGTTREDQPDGSVILTRQTPTS